MKTKLLIIGLILLGFGLINLFWYIPYSIHLLNKPFPFEFLQEVQIHDDSGFGTSISYDPFNAIQFYPYWLIWSLSLYSGIVILTIHVFRREKNEN